MASVLTRGRPVAALRFDIVALIASWATKARAARRQRLALADLRAMDAHLLGDLGINRADLFDAAMTERPMRFLAERRASRFR